MQFTINGCHMNEAGDSWWAACSTRLFTGANQAAGTTDFEKLRAPSPTNRGSSPGHRMLNGWYVYGGRRV